MKKSTWLKLAAAGTLVISAVLLSACSTAPRIHSIHEQGMDFDRYQTFAFLKKHQPEGEEYLSLSDKYLRQAIAQELRARGLREAEDADLLVGFNVSTKEKVSSTSYPSATMGYYRYRTRFGYTYGPGYGSETRVRQYTEGTLSIDVVDRERKQLIWEGVAVGRMKDKPSENLQTEVFEIVAAVFDEYPVPEQGAN